MAFGGGGGTTSPGLYEGAYEVFFSVYTAPFSGNLKDVQAYIFTGASFPASLQAAVYTADGSNNNYPQNLVGISAVTFVNTGNSSAWVTFGIPGNMAVTAGMNYCLCVTDVSPGSSTFNLGTGTGGSNLGQANMTGPDLTYLPSAFGYSGGYFGIQADYCGLGVASPTHTFTPTDTASVTPTYTPTNTPTVTNTSTPTSTPTKTVTPIICTPSTFGDTAMDAGYANPSQVNFSDYACPANGTLRDVQIYMSNLAANPVTVQAAVYTADGSGFPQNLVGVSAIQTVNTGGANAWVTFGIPGNVAVTAGTTYCLCFSELGGFGGAEGSYIVGPGGTNYGQAYLSGSDLSATPSGASLAVSGYFDIKAEYCP